MRRHQTTGRAKRAAPGLAAAPPLDGGDRGHRLQELIREEASSILRDEIQDPRLQEVRVTGVDLSMDRSRARLWYTLLDESTARPDEIERALDRATRFLKMRLVEELALRRAPDVVFRRDPATHAFDAGRSAPA